MNLAFPLIIMLCALALAGIAHRKNIQSSLVIVLLASAASFIPGLPRLELEPELILSLVVPPLLFSAAYGTSIGQFMRNLQSITALGVTLVVVTTIVIGYLTNWLLPSLGLASCFLLASVVSPPDTVTSVSHGHQLGLTRRVQSILMGESLVNDATALTLFALALSAVTHTHGTIENPLLLFLYQAVVGSVIGLTAGGISNVVRRKMEQPTLEVAFAFILPFAAYLSAEHLHASGILAVVFAAFTVSLNTFYDPRMIHQYTFRTRLKEHEFWTVVDSLLETFVFAYMGLQLRFVIEDLRASGEPFGQTLLVGLVVLLVIMLVRMLWTLLAFYPPLLGWLKRRSYERRRRKLETMRARNPKVSEYLDSGDQPIISVLTWQENVLIGWTGMRGIITLAAAAGVPLMLNGEPFPNRAVIQTVAFIVTIGTLLIQGATLPLLSRRLNLDLSADEAAEQAELAKAYAVAKTAPAGDFPSQRRKLSQALYEHQIDEAAARSVMLRLDLEQAAQGVTTDEAALE